MEMEEKPYSVDSSDDVNIEEEEEHIEDNHSKCYFIIIVFNFIYNFDTFFTYPSIYHLNFHQLIVLYVFVLGLLPCTTILLSFKNI